MQVDVPKNTKRGDSLMMEVVESLGPFSDPMGNQTQTQTQYNTVGEEDAKNLIEGALVVSI